MSGTEDRLQQLFEGFVSTGSEVPLVKQVYDALPFMEGSAQVAFLRLRFTAKKFRLQELNSVLDEYVSLSRSNRPLGFQFNSMLKSLALRDYLEKQQSAGTIQPVKMVK